MDGGTTHGQQVRRHSVEAVVGQEVALPVGLEDVRISRIRLQWVPRTRRQFGAASSHRRSPAVGGFACPRLPEADGFTAVPLSDAPPDLFTPWHRASQVSPVAYACDASELPDAGHRQATPAGTAPPSSSSPEAPFLDGHYPASVLRASHPQACPSGAVAACTADGASRVATHSIFHACRRHYPGETSRLSRRSLPGQSAAFPFLAYAPAFDVSRPARSTFRPAWSLSRLTTLLPWPLRRFQLRAL